ncbi:glycosyl hydrolase family 47 [Ostertagia ostertagi]
MGLKMGERYVITVGIIFLSAVSFLSLYLLPSSGTDEFLGREHIVPHVRDLEARRLMQEKQAAELQRKAEEAGIVAPPIPKPEIAAGDDSDARRITVKQMTKFAWDSYRKYAWGANELRPVSKTGKKDCVLYLQMYVEKAEEIAKLLLPAFDTPTGIPYAVVNVVTGSAKNYGWASGQSSILSEFGSLQLEFDYLSHVTGNKIYSEKIERIRDFLTNMDKPNGLYPLYLNPKTGKWGSLDHSIGALGDSFYEYLLKHWLITGKIDDRTKKEYDAAVFAMEKKMLFKSEKSGLWYFANLHGSRVMHKMEHLACFSGGMFALQSANEPNASVANHYLDLAEKIAHTCHESYIRSAIGIGPEAFRFTVDSEAKAVANNEKYYILRPEVIFGLLLNLFLCKLCARFPHVQDCTASLICAYDVTIGSRMFSDD